MKAYIIASEEITEIHFLWYDSSFHEILNNLSGGEAKDESNKLIIDPSDKVITCMLELLSPIIVSYVYLKSKCNEAYTTIRCCKTGCDVVFQEHDNLLYIGFTDSSYFSVSEMEKTLVMLHSLTEFFFGPCQQDIKPISPVERNRSWKKIANALQSYHELYQKEQSFLLGCVERLCVNPEILTMCSNIVEHCMKILSYTFKSSNINCGILFIGNKVLKYSSSKSAWDITTADLLQIIILINSKHEDPEFDSMNYASSAVDVFDLYWNGRRGESDSNKSDNDDSDSSVSLVMDIPDFSRNTREHLDATSNVSETSPPTSSRYGAFKQRSYSLDETSPLCSRKWVNDDISRNEEFSAKSLPKSQISFEGDTAPSIKKQEPREISFLRKRHKSTGSSISSARMYRKVDEVAGNEFRFSNPFKDVHSCPVFLHTTECPHTPYVMHTVNLAADVKFVVLSEVKSGGFASIICNFLNLLKKIKVDLDSNTDGQKTIVRLSSCCKQLRSKSRRIVGMNQQCKRIFDLWDKHIVKQLQAHTKQSNKEISIMLEQHTVELRRKLQTLYHQLFILKANKSKNEWKSQLDRIKGEMKEKLGLYFEYLIVKSYRNIEMQWERQNYPGMLHYIYVRRTRSLPALLPGASQNNMDFSFQSSRDEFTSSSLFVPSSDEDGVLEEGLIKHLKNQVWRGVSLAHACIDHKEKSVFSAVDGDFLFTSHFWCETLDGQSQQNTDASGSSTSLNKFRSSDISSFGIKFSSPFSRDFMKQLVKVSTTDHTPHTWRMYELHFIHFSTVPDTVVSEQCERLYTELSNNVFNI